MFFSYVPAAWAFAAVLIAVCELIVPYRRCLFGSMAAGAVVCTFAAAFGLSPVLQCIVFLGLSFLLISIWHIKPLKMRKQTIKVILLGNAVPGDWMPVYHGGCVRLMKNPCSITLHRGEVLQATKGDLGGVLFV